MRLQEIKQAEPYTSNIQNLTDLWKAMGARGAGPAPVLQASPRWPDRLWFDLETQPAQSDVLRLIEFARAAARPQLLPVWLSGETDRSSPPLHLPEGWSVARELSAADFKLAFEQTLMALKLETWTSDAAAGGDVHLHEVESETDDWAETASRSFGYVVPPEVTEHLAQDPRATLLLARLDGRPVGTGLVYADCGTAGLHMLGVVPEARRKGIARKLMFRLLDDAHARSFRLATLQASPMGEGLYRELGFEPHGRILNFRLA